MEFLNVLLTFTACIAVFGLSTVFASMEDLQGMKVSSVQNVDIKPGAGQQEVSEKLGGFVCKFQYRAQGGTKEEWSLSITAKKASKEWLCTVERPSGLSYLFFEEFKLEVTGAHLQKVLIEREPGVAVADVEYSIINNSVQHSPGKFKSALSKVQVYATKTSKAKKDL